MSLEVIDGAGYRLLRPTGMLDSFTRESMELSAWITKSAAEVDRHYAIDLAQVDYVNSTTLGMFVAFLEQVEAAGYRLILVASPPSVEQTLVMTGLTEVLAVVHDQTELETLLEQAPIPPRPVAGQGVDPNAVTREIEDVILRGHRTEDGEIDRLRNR